MKWKNEMEWTRDDHEEEEEGKAGFRSEDIPLYSGRGGVPPKAASETKGVRAGLHLDLRSESKPLCSCFTYESS